MSHTENYDELADRLTSEAPVKGKGKALYGADAAEHGRRMIANAITPEQFAELPKYLADPLKDYMTEEMWELWSDNTPSTLQFGGASSGKVIIPDTMQLSQGEEK